MFARLVALIDDLPIPRQQHVGFMEGFLTLNFSSIDTDKEKCFTTEDTLVCTCPLDVGKLRRLCHPTLFVLCFEALFMYCMIFVCSLP